MKTLAEVIWEFWSDHCQYRTPHNHISNVGGSCKCSYFPKYIRHGKQYGKTYLEVGKLGSMSERMRTAWWAKHTKNKTFETCPMVDFLRQNHGIKGGGKYYKEI